MWERFSFYGIRPLLILFMAATVYDGGMGLARENASAIVGIFAGSMYLAALPAAGWRITGGQQRAVWYGSILIALGHLSIALSAWLGNDLFFIGLMFIVPGSGLFKTCISVMVGTLYKRATRAATVVFAVLHGDQHRLVYRAIDLWLAYQIAWLALGLRHRGSGCWWR